MRGGHGTDTEVGRLRTVLVHRPGAELSRIRAVRDRPPAATQVTEITVPGGHLVITVLSPRAETTGRPST